jgi:hypothetical protein
VRAKLAGAMQFIAPVGGRIGLSSQSETNKNWPQNGTSILRFRQEPALSLSWRQPIGALDW